MVPAVVPERIDAIGPTEDPPPFAVIATWGVAVNGVANVTVSSPVPVRLIVNADDGVELTIDPESDVLIAPDT